MSPKFFRKSGKNFEIAVYDESPQLDHPYFPSDDAIIHIKAHESGRVLPCIPVTGFNSTQARIDMDKKILSDIVSGVKTPDDIVFMIPASNKPINAYMIPGTTKTMSEGSLNNKETTIAEHINLSDRPMKYQEALLAAEKISKVWPAAEVLDCSPLSALTTMYLSTKLDPVNKNGYLFFETKEPGMRDLDRIENQQRNVKMWNAMKAILYTTEFGASRKEDQDELISTLKSMMSPTTDLDSYHSGYIRSVIKTVPSFPKKGSIEADQFTTSLAEMIVKDESFLSAKDIVDSNLFHSSRLESKSFEELTRTRIKVHYESPAAEFAYKISCIVKPEAQRNIVQVMANFDWPEQALASGSTIDINDNNSLLIGGIKSGERISNTVASLLGDYVGVYDLKLGKKTTQTFLHNIFEMQKFHSSYKPDQSVILHTLSGESFRAYSGTEGGNMARLSYIDSDGNIVFDGPTKSLSRLHDALERRPQEFLANITQTPPGVIKSIENFEQYARALSSNTTLSAINHSGLVSNLKKESSRKDYQGWIKTLTTSNDKSKINNIMTNSLIQDGGKILSKLVGALVLTEMKLAGLSPGLDRDDDYESNGLDGDLSSRSIVLGDKECPISRNINIRDYVDGYKYGKLTSASQKAHSYLQEITKSHPSSVSVKWDEACDVQNLGVYQGKTLTANPLSSLDDIREEGSAMRHCAATYASRCMNGNYLMFSIRADGERVSTLGMDREYGELIFDQHFAEGNSSPPEEVEEIVSSWTHRIENQDIDDPTLDLNEHNKPDLSHLSDDELLDIECGLAIGSKNLADELYVAINEITRDKPNDLITREVDRFITRLASPGNRSYLRDMEDNITIKLSDLQLNSELG